MLNDKDVQLKRLLKQIMPIAELCRVDVSYGLGLRGVSDFYS
jgi:hypothetical protein